MQTYQHVSNPLRKRTINNMEELAAPEPAKRRKKTEKKE
jgi:hypothetical protein